MNDNKNFEARIAELCERSANRYCPCFTGFLTPEEQAAALYIARGFPDVFCLSFGGMEGAERSLLGFFPSDVYLRPETGSTDDERYQTYEKDAGLAFVRVTGSGYRRFSHRDVLGSLMSLGMKRETLGDILVTEDEKSAYLVTLETVAPFICTSLETVANDKVKAKEVLRGELPAKKQRFADMSLTLASVRLDALVAAALNLSRENAKRMVNSGRVFLNHAECTAVDREFSEGDTVSVKGQGKFLVESFLGKTAKDRYRVIVRKYL